MDHTEERKLDEDEKAWMKLAFEDPNAVWGHASSIAPKREKDDLLAEIEYMRELFTCYLPADKDELPSLQEHFDRLKDHATNGELLGQDRFDDDDTGSADERAYRYFSATLFKERSSQTPLLADGQDVGDSSDRHEPWSPSRDHNPISPHLSPIPECEDTQGAKDCGPQ